MRSPLLAICLIVLTLAIVGCAAEPKTPPAAPVADAPAMPELPDLSAGSLLNRIVPPISAPETTSSLNALLLWGVGTWSLAAGLAGAVAVVMNMPRLGLVAGYFVVLSVCCIAMIHFGLWFSLAILALFVVAIVIVAAWMIRNLSTKLDALKSELPDDRISEIFAALKDRPK